mgnify:CR=1 FL=1
MELVDEPRDGDIEFGMDRDEVRRLLVFGGGPVGLSFVRFARLKGMEYVGLVDSHPEKRTLAGRFGAHETFARDDRQAYGTEFDYKRIGAKLAALRQAREALKQELTQARAQLQQTLTVKQEATLVLMGILE